MRRGLWIVGLLGLATFSGCGRSEAQRSAASPHPPGATMTSAKSVVPASAPMAGSDGSASTRLYTEHAPSDAPLARMVRTPARETGEAKSAADDLSFAPKGDAKPRHFRSEPGAEKPADARLARIDGERPMSGPAARPEMVPPAADESRGPSPPSRPRQQAGQLTAGSLDDQRNFPEYLDFVNKSPLRARLPNYLPSSRVVVTVRNDKGDRIPDARIAIRPVPTDKGQPIVDVELVTESDGRAVFLAGLDYPYEPQSFQVRVTAPNTAPHETECSSKDGEWTIVVPQAPHALPTRLDLALVIDVTGSMTDELEFLKAEIDEIAARVKDQYPNITQRFGLVVYRDHGDEFVTRKFDFTESLADFQKSLNVQRAAGGGDYPEAVPEALEAALSLNWSNEGAARVMFLIGDAPPHDRDTGRTFQTVRTLRQRGVNVFPVGASGVKDEAEYIFRAAAFVTRSQYLFLTDHSGVGAPHAKPQASRYEVERLDQLMIRMIAWKLSGEEYQAERVIDVGGTETPQPTNPQPATRFSAIAVPARGLPQPGSPTAPPVRRPDISASWIGWFPWNSSAFELLWKGCLAIAVVGLLLGSSLWTGCRQLCSRAPHEGPLGPAPSNAPAGVPPGA
ncbi:MAG: VWA domain-containing protein [Planctomycetaceae bacterium]|nr:VWA domain-containing protein [Planctomycetaceae bacterium]